ncbi:MAG TPA: response regulator [Candidatus Hypogeohydataceae bacterium YC41]
MATILVVEDEKNQALLYKSQLTDEGYNVFVAGSGREAVAMAKSNPPDLVVMDINMPGMNGIEAMGKILGENNRIPIIINTAYASFRDNFMTWSADVYVVKSSDLTELKRAIKEVLEKRKAK